MTAPDLDAANSQRIWSLHMPTVTMQQVWLHFGHRMGAVLVTFALLMLFIWIFRRHWSVAALRNPAIALVLLLVGQITLGVLTVLLRKPADIASGHVAVGALTLLTAFILTIRVARISVAAEHRVVKSRRARDQERVDSELLPAGA